MESSLDGYACATWFKAWIMMNDKQMRELLLRLIRSKNETSKIDFKKTVDVHSREGQAELIKDVLGIANAESNGEETGYLIIGAFDGQTYDIAGLELDDSALQQIINKRCHRPVMFEYKQYVLEKGNTTGVIIIPKRDELPHLVKEKFFDEKGNVLLYEGECPIREGTSTRRASREDYNRMYKERMEKERQKILQQAFALVKKEPRKTVSPSDFLTMDLKSLGTVIFDMIREDDLVGLKALTNNVKLSLLKEWKKTKDKKSFDEEKVSSLKNLTIRPTLDRLTLVGKMAIEYDKGDLFLEVLKALSSVYELSNTRDLGIWGTQEHLSWTVPSKYSLENLYILGAYLTLERNIDAIHDLLSKGFEDYRRERVSMVFHPNFEHPSGEGTLTEFYDEALSHVKDLPVFFEWFDSDENRLKNAFCQFDFLVGGKRYVTQKAIHFPNFARFYKERQRSLWTHIEEEPERFKKLLGDDPVMTLSQVIKEADEFARKDFELFHSWI